MMDVTIENFETEVIAASMNTPVLVDFWATWCGPCKSLGPILEKLETEYEGRFKLVKIDTDAQPHLAQAFGIRSVPTVFLVMNGQPVDGFSGAIPEGQIKEFLDKHVPSEQDIQAQTHAQEASELAESGNAQAALAQLQEALQANPNDDVLRCQYVELLLTMGEYESARQAWAPLAPLLKSSGALSARPAALDVWLQAAEQQEHAPTIEQLEASIAENKRDFDARFALAQYWLVQGERTKALDELLEIIMRDKTWNDSAARKAYVGILELLTPPKTKMASAPQKQGAIELETRVPELDPQQKLVATYRRRLSMTLN